MNITSTPSTVSQTAKSTPSIEADLKGVAGAFDTQLSFAQFELSPKVPSVEKEEKNENYSEKVKQNRKKDDEQKEQAAIAASQLLFTKNFENDLALSNKEFSAHQAEKVFGERNKISTAHNDIIQKRTALRKSTKQSLANEAPLASADQVEDNISFSKNLDSLVKDGETSQTNPKTSQGKFSSLEKGQLLNQVNSSKSQANIGNFKSQLETSNRPSVTTVQNSSASNSLKGISGLSKGKGADTPTASSGITGMGTEKKEGVVSSKSVSAPQKPVDVKEVAGKIKLMISKDKSEITMKLTPEHLGKLEVKLKKDGDQITANLKVESIAAKELLEEQLPQLRKDLEDQGIQVKDFSIFVDQENSSQSEFAFNQDQQSHLNHQSGINNALTEDSSPSEEANPILGQNSDQNGMNIYA